MRNLLILALLAGAALPAQSVVSPAHFAAAEGNTWRTEPFGITSAPYRYLQVHGDLQGKPGQITALYLRRDGTTTSSWASFQIFCDLWLSTATTTPQTVDPAFDDNHGPDKVRVLSFAQVVFPASTHADLPAPFVYKIPFATPFTFGGTGPLCWETTVQVRQNNFTAYFDAASGSSTNPSARTQSIGTGCKVAGLTSAMSLSGSSSMSWNSSSGTLRYNGTRAPSNSLALLLVGISKDSYGGLPLPFELPGTAAANSGPCYLYVAQILALPAFTDSSGRFTLNLGVPLGPELNGVSVYGQALTADQTANPLGLGTSNLVEHHIIAPWTTVPVGHVRAANLGATGTRINSNGLVVAFDIM